MLSAWKTSFWKGGGQRHLETSKQLKSFRERKVVFCPTNIVLSPLKVTETLLHCFLPRAQKGWPHRQVRRHSCREE